MALVEIERADGVALLTLNRPDAMNALSRAMQDALHAAIEDVEADPAVRVIVITGAGERAFTAGLDLKELAAHGLSLSPDGVRGPDPVRRLMACAKPVIGAVNGVAVTGGFELALACDILIASTKARFADTHVRVGVTPGWGLSQALSRRIGLSRAKELSLSGNFLDAQTAAAWGLVNRVTAPADLIPAARRLALDIASCDPAMVGRYKALIDDGFDLPYGEARALELQRAAADNAAVTPEAVAARREAIQARGRGQAG